MSAHAKKKKNTNKNQTCKVSGAMGDVADHVT